MESLSIKVPRRNRHNPIPSMIPRLLVVLAVVALSKSACAFCGFYVAKADTKLFNKASQVALVRDGSRTVLTMANDYEGDPKEFALVVSVPVIVKKDQVRVVEKALLDHLDAYSAPRLVEYFDEDPCAPMVLYQLAPGSARASRPREQHLGAKALGVTIEESFTVGEYDILVLSAKESEGLETWLAQNEYKIPPGASEVLGSYIKQGMKFFVAKVNLAARAKSGATYLRPLQVTFKSRRFMLPIRLGTVNARGPQELFIYALSRKGRVETTNYRTVKLPSDLEVPLFVKDDFSRFYRDLFARAVKRDEMRVLFTEYAWDMGWCDPCAADPLTNAELRELGATWVRGKAAERPESEQIFLTRPHVRYDRAHFPEDLIFQETGDRENFQGRYVLRHEWRGKDDGCKEAREYRKQLPKRREEQAQTLARATGWDISTIRERAAAYVDTAKPPKE